MVRRLRLGRPRRALIVAPHPDDEAIGAWALIRALRLRGCEVRVLIVTDGAGSHRHSARWPTARLVAERRRETRRAMRALGVAAGGVIFLALPDGRLGARHAVSIAQAVRRHRDLDLIVGPDKDDGHPDHRHVAAAIARARPRARRLSYLVWPHDRRVSGPAWGLPLGPQRRAKRRAVAGYRTQMGIITDDPAGFAIAAHELHAFTGAMELFA